MFELSCGHPQESPCHGLVVVSLLYHPSKTPHIILWEASSSWPHLSPWWGLVKCYLNKMKGDFHVPSNCLPPKCYINSICICIIRADIQFQQHHDKTHKPTPANLQKVGLKKYYKMQSNFKTTLFSLVGSPIANRPFLFWFRRAFDNDPWIGQ